MEARGGEGTGGREARGGEGTGGREERGEGHGQVNSVKMIRTSQTSKYSTLGPVSGLFRQEWT